MADFSIKQGDTAPSYVVTLVDARSTDWDLGGATVKFSMRRLADGVLVIDHRECLIIDEEECIVRVDWTDDDTELAGLHIGEFEVLLANGRPETFPDDGHLLIQIKAQADELALAATLCTVDDVALYIPDLNAEEAVFAATLAIPRVEAEAEAFLQHALLRSTRTEGAVPIWPEQALIPLRYTPVISVSHVAIDNVVVPTDSWIMLRTGVVVGIPGYLTSASLGGPTPSSASVTYVGGLGVPAVDSLKPALVSRMARIVTKYRDLALGTDQVTAERYAVQYLSEGFTVDEMQTLMPYRNMSEDRRLADVDLRHPFAQSMPSWL